MKTLALTRAELVDLLEVIAAEVTGKGAPSPEGTRRETKPDSCGLEVCPHAPQPPAADARAIALTRDLAALAALIDHTLLRPEAARGDIEKLCEESRLLGFATVCVNPAWVALSVERLRGSAVKVATVTGFPLGATSTAAKRAEAGSAIRAGAMEIDMVMNVGAMKSAEYDWVGNDMRGVAEVCRAGGALLKVILENAYLSDEEKKAACRLAQEAGADFVKTSTGFGPSGATAADVRLMREVVGDKMGVKAAGGIRTLADALRLLDAGASRLGTSSSVAILAEAASLMA